MPHGTPDWGHVGPKRTVYGLDDLGEHAVRMGSPNLWDRRGDVLALDDFRDGMGQWIPYISGLDAAIELWAGHSRSGVFSVRCVTGRSANFYAGLQKYVPFPVLSRIGLEFSFNLHALTRYWHGRIRWGTTAQGYDARVRYNSVNGFLEYWDGAWQFLADPPPASMYEYPTHSLKFVVDMTLPQPEYVRWIYNYQSAPMTGILVENPGPAATPELFFEVLHYTDVVANAPAFVDNIIVTQNEP